MRHSMTGFASQSGQALGRSWSWELRGVNGKGLDLRLRIPDWIDGLEAQYARVLTEAAGSQVPGPGALAKPQTRPG